MKVASKAIDEISLGTGAKLTVNGDLSIAGDFELECSTGAVAVQKWSVPMPTSRRNGLVDGNQRIDGQ